MRVGLSLSGLASTAADARQAEEAGFDDVTCGEHLSFYGPVPNAFISLAAAAGATDRVGLISTVSLAPLYPPALFAKMAASLDVISDGRLELGVGAGGTKLTGDVHRHRRRARSSPRSHHLGR